MSQPLSPHLPTFAMNDWLFDRALTSIPESEGDRRLDPSTNPARSIALHLLASRHGLCKALGLPAAPLPWSPEQLGTGTKTGFLPDSPKPSLTELRARWQELQPHFQHALRDASAAALAQPSPMGIPGKPEATMADFAALNVVHECYHLGQLGLLVKAITGQGLLNPVEQGAA